MKNIANYIFWTLSVIFFLYGVNLSAEYMDIEDVSWNKPIVCFLASFALGVVPVFITEITPKMRKRFEESKYWQGNPPGDGMP